MIAMRALQLLEETEHFCYRPVCLADAYPLYAASQHPKFVGAIDGGLLDNIEGVSTCIRTLMEEELLNRSGAVCIVEKTTGKWRGLLRWVPFLESMRVELWIIHSVEQQTNELLDQAVAHVFTVTSLKSLYCAIPPQDSIMARSVQKTIGIPEHCMANL
jgi:hypothetical protein